MPALSFPLDFPLDFSKSVEMIFRANPEIRDSDVATYCLGGPEHSPHVAAQVRVAPGEGSLCPELAENTNYYVFRDGVYLMLATTQANALAHVPIPLSAGTGVSMDLHVFDWLEFPPMPIADGTTTGPSWDALMGREFKDGIYLVLSTVDTGVTSPGAVGFFDAAYTR